LEAYFFVILGLGFRVFQATSHTYDIHLVELHDINQLLLLTEELNFQASVCYIDTIHYARILKEPTPKFHKYVILIQDIKDMIFSTCLASIAHFLAMFSVSSTLELLVYISPLSGLSDLLFVYFAKIWFLRL